MIGKLLSRMLPLDRILALALRLGLLKRPLEWLLRGWKGAQGYRTQAAVASAAVVALGAFFGAISWEEAKHIILGLAGVAGPTLLEKIERVLPLIDKVAEEVQKNAKAQEDQAAEAPKA